jgi:uncharacterized linocin/CFP29 family protein
MNNLAAAIAAGLMINGAQVPLSGLAINARRPILEDDFQRAYILAPTGRLNAHGKPTFAKKYFGGPVHVNATLRKDEWVRVDETVLEAFRERLTIVADLQAAGLTFNVGGLGVLISEWEKSSEITDAEITMDGETQVQGDRQEFALNGVPIPVIQKPFRIGERVLLASRTRGASLDVTTGTEAARAVARTSERMVFYGTSLGASTSDGNSYTVSGLTTFADRALLTVGDWSDPTYTPAEILDDILNMVRVLETQHRRYGPFNVYIPGDVAWRFRQDFKAFGDRTLMERVLAEPSIRAVRVSDALEATDVLMIQMTSDTLDLAVASDSTTIQWASPSGWTNFFQVFAAWAPRLKSDFDGRTGILHATLGS